MTLTRRAAVMGASVLALGGHAARAADWVNHWDKNWDKSGAKDPFRWRGRLCQGGFIIGQGAPGEPVSLDGAPITQAGPKGLFFIGFDRDQGPVATVETSQGRQVFAVQPVAYAIQRIDGLPPEQVTPQNPALLARIQRESEMKAKAFASRIDSEDFASGFSPPLTKALRTSAFGPQRILNGVPKTPHYGVDLAAPTGTPIYAPADGRVVLAETDLWFEGGLTLIDHGQGLVCAFLHQSRLDVREGDLVRRGQTLGAVGAKGRATGPHLCWRATWRGRHLDPSLLLKPGEV